MSAGQQLHRRSAPAITPPMLVAECRGCAEVWRLRGSSGPHELRRQIVSGIWPGADPRSIDSDYPVVADVDAWARAGAAHGVLDAAFGRGPLGMDRVPPSPPLDTAEERGAASAFYVGFYAIGRGLMTGVDA